ncbi:putative RNA polymerase II subunit B1 CTD phosphatase rpap2 [Engraulis encrasicolus]|uniref:putative RNA polymerase II subunit B1 CTD phosphatase rpap2 n=1 Tax=Engraulis encrasicolus TaxID=184585 RepID=UPI002FD1188C
MDSAVTTKKPTKGKRASSKTDALEAKKREFLKEKLREKLEHERRALQVVERLLDSAVSEHILIQSARLITVDNYSDIIEERSIAKLCGYPICPNELYNVPGQKYKISTKTNKVYDITERKCFCCNFCYKASKWFEVQISKTPLWLRVHENIPDVKLMAKEDGGSSGLEVKLLDGPLKEADIENPGPPEPRDPSDEFYMNNEEGPQSDFISTAMAKCNLRVRFGETTQVSFEKEAEVGQPRLELEYHRNPSETGALQGCSIPTPSSANDGLLILEKNTQADDHEFEKASFNPSSEKPSPQASTSLAHTPDGTDPNVAQAGMSKAHMEGSPGQAQRPRTKRTDTKATKLSLMEGLRLALLDWKTEETMELLHGSDSDTADLNTCQRGTEESSVGVLNSTPTTGNPDDTTPDTRPTSSVDTPASDVHSKKCSTTLIEGHDLPSKDSRSPALPLVDCHSQHAIRKGIVVEKLCRSLKNILGPLRLTMTEVSTNFNYLARTFSLSSTNIIHKGPVWTVLAVVLLHVLVEVSPAVRDSLARPSSKESIASLLKELHLTDQDLQSLVQLFCQDAQ